MVVTWWRSGGCCRPTNLAWLHLLPGLTLHTSLLFTAVAAAAAVACGADLKKPDNNVLWHEDKTELGDDSDWVK